MANDRVGNAIEVREAQKAARATLEQRIKQYEKWWQAAMPKGSEAAQLVRDAVHCIRTNPELAGCDIESIMGGLTTCAQLGLRPGVANLGHAWLVPLKGKAALWLGYRGMIDIAYRNPRIETISGRAVFENEAFKASYEPPAIAHDPVAWADLKGNPVGYYSVARMARGGLIFNTLSEAESEVIRAQQLKIRASGPWRDHPEPMKIKTAMRRMWRWLPMSLEMQAVEAIDGSVRLDASPDIRPEDASQIIDSDAEETDNPVSGQRQE